MGTQRLSLRGLSLRCPVATALCFVSVFAFGDRRQIRGRESEESIAVLIDTLASPNERPARSREPDRRPIYRPGYDHVAQNRVYAAWDALIAKGVEAFPHLIEHVNDERYSCTVMKFVHENKDVGDVCYQIIAEQVQVYKHWVYQKRGSLRDWLPYGWRPQRKEKMSAWWEGRKRMTLRDLQLEAARWAFATERERDDYDGEEKARNLRGLERLVRRLEASQEPILVSRGGAFLTDKELKGNP